MKRSFFLIAIVILLIGGFILFSNNTNEAVDSEIELESESQDDVYEEQEVGSEDLPEQSEDEQQSSGETNNGDNSEGDADNREEPVTGEDQQGNNDEGETSPDTDANSDEPTHSGPLTEDTAIQKVKEYLNIQDYEEVNVIIDREENGAYIVQVYDVIPGGNGSPGHTMTRGWYSVNKVTGEVIELY
ncbi:hypothetical protein [Alkalihalophilus marmarensis]|uniref:hypothetical protein n=1 Tax=Alkalihalophilus marmarensis TaxID=521377 RepID=UPI002E236C04|nr:hypothetical protein [Alkalihalophilus marmarensis]